jgi:hypothetical protein
MCIHMHHSDTHLDQVIYCLGEFEVTVTATSLFYLLSILQGCLILSDQPIIIYDDVLEQDSADF